MQTMGAECSSFWVEERGSRVKKTTTFFAVRFLWASHSPTPFEVRQPLSLVSRSSSSLLEFKSLASICQCAITDFTGVFLSTAWKLWCIVSLCFMRVWGLQLSEFRLMIRYIPFVGQLTCQILACKIHSREVASVDAPNGSAWYVGIRCASKYQSPRLSISAIKQ